MNSKLLALSISLLAITACNGSSGGSTPLGLQGGVTPQENASPLTNVNGSLQGMYFSSGQSEGDWLNLAPYGTEYLELYEYDSIWSAGSSGIVIKDWQTGLVVQEFEVAGKVSGLATTLRFSPDGQVIGLLRDEFDTFDYKLAFFHRTGELIAEFADDNISAYEWLLDGRFVYYQNGSLHVATLSQNSIRSRPLVSLQGIQGSPRNIKVSPDGQYLVFEMVTDVPPYLAAVIYRNASVYRVKTDGTELTLVATMANSSGLSVDEPRVNNPLWSLDGQFLMMSVGVSSAAVIIWEQSYSSVTDDYEPLSISDVIVASSEGFMYLLPSNASDVVFLNGQSFPAIAHNSGGTPAPYQISSLHIEPGAALVPAVERLPETIVTPSGQTGSLLYLKDSFEDEFENAFTVMEYNTRTAQERVLLRVEGRDFDDAAYFGVSSDKRLFAMWDRQSYDEMYLRIFDSTGAQQEFFQMVYYDSGTVGRRLLSAPQFSPVNNSLLLYRFLDEDTNETGFGVLDWTTGKYKILETGAYRSVAWAPDGAIILSQDNSIYGIDYVNNDFTNPQLLFTPVNPAFYLSVNPQGTKLAYVMAGHLFHSNINGTDTVQVTAPSSGSESHPVWSPDGRNISIIKGAQRHIISADSRNLQIYPGVSASTSRFQFVTRQGSSTGYWQP